MGLINIVSKASISFLDLISAVKKEFRIITGDSIKNVSVESDVCLIFGKNENNILLITNLECEDVYNVVWVSIDKSVHRKYFSDSNRVNLIRVFSSKFPFYDYGIKKVSLNHKGDFDLNEKTVSSIATWTVDTGSGLFYKRRTNSIDLDLVLYLYTNDLFDFDDDLNEMYKSKMAPNRHRLNLLYNKGKEYSVHNRRITVYNNEDKGFQTSINAARLVYCASTFKTLDDIKDYEVDHICNSLNDSASNLQLATGRVNKLLQHYRRIYCNM